MSRLQQQAIVIGDSFNNTLGLIRSLGEAKVDIVLLLVGDDRLFVSKSRYLKKSQIFQMETIDDCLPTLLRIADKTKQQTIICTNDIATQYIDEYETTLCSLYITPMKGRHLGNLLNKDEQCRLAENCGLTIPQSIIYNRNEDFPTVSYPILMKPANSNTGEKSDIHICYCQKDVNKALSATSTCNQFIIQKFIEKEYEINLIGVSTVNGVYIPGGIRKIRHYPTIYSPCSFGVFQSVENLNVDVHSILKLMQHVGYHGPFSVELLHKNAKNYFKYLLSLPKSLWFNFRHLPLKQALKLPFYVRYGTRVSVKGRIIIEDDNHVGMAMIVIGSHEADVSDPKHTTCLTVERGGELVFQHTAHIGLGTKIFVKHGARMYLGDNFAVSANSQFVCYKSIIMGRDIQFAWNCLVMDSDTHSIYSDKGCIQKMNPDKEVRIGDKVWIGCRVTILKGSHVPSNCVIGATSFVSGSKFESNSLIVGSPAKSVKPIAGWEL